MAILVLVGVMVGFRPQWLCIPHWYVAFSLATRTTVLNGGDAVAQILTLLLIPCCLGDRRAWQWSHPTERLAPTWSGSSYAAVLLLRCQLAGIYLEAAVSKLAHASWRQGKAMPAILLGDPLFALTGNARELVEQVFTLAWTKTAMSLSVIGIELAIGGAILGRAGIRRLALALVILLHAAIILAMGLFSFGLIMIAAMVVASMPTRYTPSRLLRPAWAGDRASDTVRFHEREMHP